MTVFPAESTQRPFWPQPTDDFSQQAIFRAALICFGGHTQDAARTSRPTGELGCCSHCGDAIIGCCLNCGMRLQGTPAIASPEPYTPPEFCDGCGHPHPWAGREARIARLKRLLRNQDLADDDRDRIAADLERLRDPDLSEHEQAEILGRIKHLTPAFVHASWPILKDLITAAAKNKLGLS